MSRRSGVPLVRLTVLALVPALAIAGVWQFADANVPPPTTTTTTTLPPEPVDELATDLLSLRRHPTPLAERAAEDDAETVFVGRVAALGADIGDASCLRIVDDADVVVEFGAGVGVIPASNEKLFVAAAALGVLGSDHRFRTELMSVPPEAGVITGNVYLVGGGDPVLTTADVPDPQRYPAFNTTSLEELADQFAALGITTIDGDVVGDGSRYDDEFRVPSWGDDITSTEAGPYDALLVNDGLISNGNYGLDPSRSAARTFTDLLIARGITITGSAANATRPADAGLTTLTFIESLPLTDVLVELMHTSDDNTAEMLVKEIGFVGGEGGTRPAGLAVVRTTLGGWGVPLEGVELQDGSGLSRLNRATCAALAALFATPVADELRDVLPVAGRDGTLATQLLDTEAEGRLQAKTGTLTDVKALTGTQPGADRRDVDFALVLNGEDVDDAEVYGPIWERLVALITDYPIVVEPDIDRFAPL
ncbi:D-alanyl-D-alanine carboxypeptidase/D-alanyl-D-alanine-endopeptidase [Ilumatobacter sp.]|uniref:D-alanyl-D-alanine carboxypeptidase/D-alanyl-D-alanine endopeptidase n=1 Tax=Ilumatobacter sp. TaxID=1967498 RepID=UPI003AF8167D